jgi:hypothetical protein
MSTAELHERISAPHALLVADDLRYLIEVTA